MNETINNILERRTIRAFKEEQVPDEIIEQILQCALFAPSANGKQPWHFTVLQNRELMDKGTEAGREALRQIPEPMAQRIAEDPIYSAWRGAPTAIIVSGEDANDSAVTDCANAMQNMCIAAQSLGISACYMTSFKMGILLPGKENLLRELGIPEGFTPLYCLALGYGDEIPHPRDARRENSINYVR
jgi:nitroreductase